MSDGRWTEAEIKCAVLWRMARRHAWANCIPIEDLVRAVPSHERGRARSLVAELTRAPFVEHHRNRGFKIENEHVDGLARALRDECGFGELRIEATLSHFGGFDRGSSDES